MITKLHYVELRTRKPEAWYKEVNKLLYSFKVAFLVKKITIAQGEI